MYYKSLLKRELTMLTFVLMSLIILFATNPVASETNSISIEIIHPKSGQMVGAVDSTFILGNLPTTGKSWHYSLEINGSQVPVHTSGGFIAFLPVVPGEFLFVMEAHLEPFQETSFWSRLGFGSEELKPDLPDKIYDTLMIIVPEPIAVLSMDSLLIAGDYKPPSGHLVVTTKDQVRFGFRGTPGCRAWCTIPGLADSVPMSEIDPIDQAYWGESVFGAGAVPDSLKVRGIYTGLLQIGADMQFDSLYPEYHLAPPSRAELMGLLFNYDTTFSGVDLATLLKLNCLDPVTSSARFHLTANSTVFPRTIEFIDSVQIIRHGPRKGYFSIFQPKGVRCQVVGQEGDWYKLQLSPNQTAWAHMKSVRMLKPGVLPPRSYLRSVRFESEPEAAVVKLPLAGKHPFKVTQVDDKTLEIRLYGVISDTDWIRYESSDDLIELVTWTQPEVEVYELRVKCRSSIWGYDSRYQSNTLILSLFRPPVDLGNIRGKIIVLDPGHSHDPGAIGPTGMTEAEANLGLALAVRDELQKRGAQVVMTRDDDSHVPIYDRPDIAFANNADLFVSIHNNALPDGVNPFVNNGTSAYYYHPHSIDLARLILKYMIDETGLSDHGLYYGNLAVNRPTQYPAVLIECAFMILPEHEAMLGTYKFRGKVATAIRKGIEEFLKGRADEH